MVRLEITVVVCTYNRAELLRGALESLVRQRTSGHLNYEVIVVDDGSADSTKQVVDAYRHSSSVPIRYVSQMHAGIAAARNRGVRESYGDWIAFFDDDQGAECDWLFRLVENAAAVDCVGGPYLLRLPEHCDLVLDQTLRSL